MSRVKKGWAFCNQKKGNLTKFHDPNFYRTLIYGMTTIGLESYRRLLPRLCFLIIGKKEFFSLSSMCIFRVQETVNRVFFLLSEDYACLIFFTLHHRKLYSTNSISAGKIGMHGFFVCFKDASSLLTAFQGSEIP